MGQYAVCKGRPGRPGAHCCKPTKTSRSSSFAGRGYPIPPGLPTFSGLVKQLYGAMGIDPNPVQASAIKAGQYDTAVMLLEAEVKGTRPAVREALARILTPNLAARNATATHEALLTLAKDRKDRTRLITTNFDRLFEEVIARTPLQVQHFRAPLLPVPKKRWDGLVYLHGLLTDNPSESDLERLVISSGDFGLAYLTERWAARFVSELLRNFVVCFVGYSTQRSGAEIHDGRPRCGSTVGGIVARDVRIRELLRGQSRACGEGVDSKECKAHPLS